MDSWEARPQGAHFNYDELDDCVCYLCNRLRRLTCDFVAAQEACKDLPYRSNEEPAQRLRKAQRTLLAHSNKRVVYSELSFVTNGRSWQRDFLLWVWDRIMSSEWRTEGWWVNCSEHKILGSWIAEWDADRQAHARRSAFRLVTEHH